MFVVCSAKIAKITTYYTQHTISMPKDFNVVSLISKKRDGEQLENDEITYLINQYTDGGLPDYQMSAFLMAAFLNGLNEEETAALTLSMLHSGKVLDLSAIPGKKVDKHSTGGVGDKPSLILAPIVASCGVPVPMISGRGLGHTGGTLDKLESIPGFTVDITLKKYHSILKACGMVMAGQTKEIAPADKRLYALRDVTATVESIPLIAGSIMSKKLAEGIDALVLDVKFGAGAFMKTQEESLELARTLVEIGQNFNKETIAYLTNMEQPLGMAVGNWLEAKEAVQALKGIGPPDVMEVTNRLSGTMIYLGEKADTIEEGIEKSKQAVTNGQAYKKWMQLTKAQGGDISVLEEPEKYEAANHSFYFKAEKDGYITAINAQKVGLASLELGAGRKTKEDKIDPAAGILFKKKVDDAVKKGDVLSKGFTNDEQAIELAESLLKDAVDIESAKGEPDQLITHIVDKDGVRKF